MTNPAMILTKRENRSLKVLSYLQTKHMQTILF